MSSPSPAAVELGWLDSGSGRRTERGDNLSRFQRPCGPARLKRALNGSGRGEKQPQAQSCAGSGLRRSAGVICFSIDALGGANEFSSASARRDAQAFVRETPVTATSPAADAKPKGVPLRTIFTFASPGLAMGPLGMVLGLYLPPYYGTWAWPDGHGGDRRGRPPDRHGAGPDHGPAIDRTKTLMGRFRPWMIAGSALVDARRPTSCCCRPASVPKEHLIRHLMIWSWSVGRACRWITFARPRGWPTSGHGYHDRARVYGWMAPFSVSRARSLCSPCRCTPTARSSRGKHRAACRCSPRS